MGLAEDAKFRKLLVSQPKAVVARAEAWDRVLRATIANGAGAPRHVLHMRRPQQRPPASPAAARHARPRGGVPWGASEGVCDTEACIR